VSSELYALFIAASSHPDNVLNILIAPTEIGSGSLPAASGCHFDPVAPAGHHVSAGALVDGMPVERIRVECVPLRGDDGARSDRRCSPGGDP
jgi:hypothetical protein